MHEPIATTSLLVMLVTGVLSYRGFINPRFEEKYIFRPESILSCKEFYRLLTSAFLHANWYHLIFNMMSFYFFGSMIEFVHGAGHLLTIYLGGIIGGNLLSLWIHRHHEYAAYGASGGVCGVIFAHIFLFPGGSISSFLFPISIPSWLYAICFMLGSFYALKAQRDNIGHDAHLGGAIVGLLITTALHPWIVPLSPKLFAAVLLLSIALFIYLLFNPLFLPAASVLDFPFWRKTKHPNVPKYRDEQLRIDELLEKVSNSGMDSLTAEEKRFLNEVSGKLQRRADSKKPESGLTF